MRYSVFSEEQIIGILRLAVAGQTVAEVIRQHGISETTYCHWKAQYDWLDVSQLRRLRQLEEENRKLKQIVADLTLDNTALKEIASEIWYGLPSNGRQWAICRKPLGYRSGAPFARWASSGARPANSDAYELTKRRCGRVYAR